MAETKIGLSKLIAVLLLVSLTTTSLCAEWSELETEPERECLAEEEEESVGDSTTNRLEVAAPAATGFLGAWELLPNNVGISAMHTQLIPRTDKIAIFDASVWHISRLELPPNKRPCVRHFNKLSKVTADDCWCHSVLYDYNKNQVIPLKVQTDTWCSSGGLTVDGQLVSTGGFMHGSRASRYLWGCDTCDWVEYPETLADERWYSTQAVLSDGSFLVFGGRAFFSYEFIPPPGVRNQAAIPFPFLRETEDWLRRPGNPEGDIRLENNLYPFVFLLPDNNLYVFANTRSVLLDPRTNQIVKEFPVMPGIGPRSYPSTATGVLLPIYVPRDPAAPVDVEVLICGGALRENYYYCEREQKINAALDDCGRMVLTSPTPAWVMERMPESRVMADGVLLPNGEVLIVNGATDGSAGWHCSNTVAFKPLLYKPNAPAGQRFNFLTPSEIPRMYHSVANLLPDGRVFIGGSNDNDGYIEFTKFPTELRIEKFSPPYLAPELAPLRPEILAEQSDNQGVYSNAVTLKVKCAQKLNANDVQVSLISPPFVTHSISMNQRHLFLSKIDFKNDAAAGVYEVVVAAPHTPMLAPPGYYMLSVVNKGVPSVSVWFQLHAAAAA